MGGKVGFAVGPFGAIIVGRLGDEGWYALA